jgi:hypothetical protein
VTRWNTLAGFFLSATLAYLLIVLLPFFVIPRYSVPFLPFLAAAAAAWFEGRKPLARSTLAIFFAAVLLATAVASWRSVFPRHPDPAAYTAHKVLATWPQGVGNQTWRAVHRSSGVVEGPDVHNVLCGPSGVALEAEAPRLRLENNQIVLFPLRARSPDGQVLVQLFWKAGGQKAFVEKRSALAIARLGAWTDVSFRIPAQPDAALTHLRLDTGDDDGLSVKLRPSRVTSEELPEAGLPKVADATADWSCIHHCAKTAGDAYLTTGDDPYFSSALDPLSMEFDLRVKVSVSISPAPEASTKAVPANISGEFRWRDAIQTKWPVENHADFSVTEQTDWVWVRLNPSLYEGIKLWAGELGGVRLILRCSSFRILEIGTMTLVKDQRMVGAE